MTNPQRPQPALPTWVYFAAIAAVVVLALLWFAGAPDDAGNPDAETQTPGETPSVIAADDSPECDDDVLTDEAQDTMEDIESGGPFTYDRDGLVFENREGLLPEAQEGYYREYTVDTPGASDRGARRIVTAGEDPQVADDPDAWWYTEDHYVSFCLIPAG